MISLLFPDTAFGFVQKLRKQYQRSIIKWILLYFLDQYVEQLINLSLLIQFLDLILEIFAENTNRDVIKPFLLLQQKYNYV